MSTKSRLRAIDTVLVANRGEIALRVVRAVRALGKRAVVACSEADTESLAARHADDVFVLGAAPAIESYLSIERILAAARASGADAVHPGYGFLSEREEFARAVEGAGLVFIGPSPEHIRLMGDKLQARATLAAAGIPVVPGEEHAVADASQLGALADRVGLPLLLKAAAGGGGKGIRLVRSKGELAAALRLAQSEAQNAFGDATVFAERYLERARHVEVQIVGDGRGGARIYPERDCSIQRRHQKLVEESPCPALSEALREALLGRALRAVQVSKYRGAGTLEFLWDGAEGLYFLEMNTRLQVEHPVTELVCGIDLVAEQIAIAEGRTLGGATLDETRVRGAGAAVELRVNAEDPEQGFAPSTGRLTRVHIPAGPGVRVDSGAFAGLEITPHYDSLVAKLIAHAPDRARALERLRVACEEAELTGVATTIPVGLALLDDAEFTAGRYHCQYLEERLADPTFLAPSPDGELARALAIAALAARELGGAATRSRTAPSRAADATAEISPWARLGRSHGLRGLDR